MKPRLLLVVVLLATHIADAQNTAFVYQGRLVANSAPANGIYDLRFTIFNTNEYGYPAAPVLTNANITVTDGLFTTALDFGAGVFTGTNYWLEIGVRTNGSTGSFTTLAPRQQITPTPYAINAATANSAVTAASVTGSIADSQLSANIARLDASQVFTGTITAAGFAGNGAAVSNVNALSLNGSPATAFWNRTGNSNTTAGTDFIGTRDNQPLEFKVRNMRALRLEPNSTSPNLIGGYSSNFIAAGVIGAVISGGGETNWVNSISANSSIIGSGLGNTIKSGARGSMIGAGESNTIETNALQSSIVGGNNNQIYWNAYYSAILGGEYNRIAPDATASSIGGGYGNTIEMDAWDSLIAGGSQNLIQSSASFGSVGGGAQNTIQGNASFSSVGGGGQNTIQNNASGSVIAGGQHNSIGSNATQSAIGGGSYNTNQAGAFYSVIAGGRYNLCTGPYGSIAGGGWNAAGTNSFAAGYRAKATNSNSFVWSDSTESDFTSTGDNQFLVRASGGAGIGTSDPSAQLTISSGGGDSFPQLQIDQTNLTDYARLRFTQQDAYATRWDMAASSNAFVIYSGIFGSEKLRLDGAGLTTDGAITATTFYGSGSGLTGVVQLGSDQTFTGLVNFNPASGAPFSVGSTNKIPSLNADLLDGMDAAAFWNKSGNSGTLPGTNFIGTTDNQALEFKVNNVRALRIEPSSGTPNVVGGAAANSVAAGITGGTIGGGGESGYANNVFADFATIGGGRNNAVTASYAYDSTVGGGFGNQIAAPYSTVGGGMGNLIAINPLGWNHNTQNATIGGGWQNEIESGAARSTIGGGEYNKIRNDATISVIGGGASHVIGPSAYYATISGGYGNTIYTYACQSTISGGVNNTVDASATNAVVSGGENNVVTGQCGVIPGGRDNSATNYAFAAGRRAKANHTGAFVWADSTAADFRSSTNNQFLIRASGGVGINKTNPATALDVNGTVAATNILSAGGTTASPGYSFNGDANTGIFSSGPDTLGLSTGGSERLHISPTGGIGIGTNGSAAQLDVSGGGNVTYPLLRLNQTTLGDQSRLRMTVNGDYNRRWDIGADTNFFNIWSGLYNSELLRLDNTGLTVRGAFVSSSDRNAKENFTSVDVTEILEKVIQLPLSHWNYRGDTTQHIGPMAQDFHAAFNVGFDDKHIATVDEGGVALAAIQGLNQKVEDQKRGLENRDAEIQLLKKQNASLEKRLRALEECLGRRASQ